MPNDPILHMLGLARKAGRLEIGEEPVGAACRARQAKLVLLACDAASNTFRRAAHFGEAGNVLWLEVPFTKAELGFALGRGSCAMLALTDVGFASSLVQKLSARDPEKYGPAAQPRRPAAEGEGRQDPPAAEREAPAREEPAGGQTETLGGPPAGAGETLRPQKAQGRPEALRPGPGYSRQAGGRSQTLCPPRRSFQGRSRRP